MIEKENKFRDGLIESESLNPVLKDNYEREVKNMLEKKLNLTKKICFITTGIMSLCMGGYFGYIALTAKELPGLIRLGFGFGAVMGLLWTGLMLWIVKRGRLNLRTDSKMTAGWAWGVVVVNMTILLLVSGKNPDSTRSVFMIVSGLVFLLMGAVFMIADKISQSELNTREQILRIELHLAELTESLNKK